METSPQPKPDEAMHTSSPQPNHVLLSETFRDFEGDEQNDEAPFYTDEESPLRPGMKLGSSLVQTMRENIAKRALSTHVTPPNPIYEVLAVGKAKATLDASFEVAVKLRNLKNGVEEVWKLDSPIWERFVAIHS